MGLLAVLVAAPLQMTNQLAKTSSERLIESAEAPTTLRMFAQQFSGAQIVRSPLISCGGNSKSFKTESLRREDGIITLKPANATDTTSDEVRRFSLPFSSASTMAAIDETTSDGIMVTDAGPFNKGDLVVLVNAENSGIAGLFEIRDKEDKEPRLFLKDAKIDDIGDCEVSAGNNTSLSTFKSLASTKGLRNAILLRFHVANYQVVGDSIYVRVYPQTRDGEFTSVFVDKFESLNIYIQYQKRKDAGATLGDDDFNEVEGTVWATIEMVMLEPNQGSARAQVRCGPEDFKDDPARVCRDGQIFDRRSIKNTMRITLASSKTLNGQVTTGVISRQNLFPTCYIKAQEEGFGIELPKDLQNCATGGSSKLYRVSGAVSERGLAQVNLAINATKIGASKICCINAGELKALADPRKPTDPKDIQVFGDSFALRGTVANLDEMLCSVTGSVQLEGKLTYFDPGTKRSQMIRCNDRVGVLSGLDSEFEVSPAGDRVRCTQSGYCHIPKELTETTTGEVRIGRFHQDVSCEWSDGQQRDCCDSLPADPSLKLRKVELVVSNLKIRNPDRLSAVCK